MKRVSIMLLVALAASLMVTAPTLAQRQGRYRGRTYTKADVERIIKRVEDESDDFKKIVDKSLDRSVLDGTKREDSINEQVKEFEKALDKLRSEFDRRQRWEETHDQVKDVLKESDEINRLVRTRLLGPAIEKEWAVIRADLNRLAGIYNLPLLKP
jgi:DNA repair exonuclease SbcCD ATPase subunit